MVRRLRDLASEQFGQELGTLWKHSGGIPHDPVGMLCVWLYGFLQGVSTSRRLEELCRYDVRYSHLSYGTRPDHTTLYRFCRQLDGRLDEMLAHLFVSAKERGLVSSSTVALDGTKLAGKESQWRKARLAALDCEAKVMKGGSGDYLVGYNVQSAVYVGSGYVGAIEVLDECNDKRAVPPVLEAMKAQSELVETLVADGGYNTALNHSALHNAGISPVIIDKGRRSRTFTQDADGSVRCPAGHVAQKSLRAKQGVIYDRYRVSHCRHCPLRAGCGAKSHQHDLHVPTGMSLKEAGVQPSETPEEDHALLKARAPTVELFFALMKELRGFRRLHRKGLQGARAEMRLWTLAHNLNLLLQALFDLLRAILDPIGLTAPFRRALRMTNQTSPTLSRS